MISGKNSEAKKSVAWYEPEELKSTYRGFKASRPPFTDLLNRIFEYSSSTHSKFSEFVDKVSSNKVCKKIDAICRHLGVTVDAT